MGLFWHFDDWQKTARIKVTYAGNLMILTLTAFKCLLKQHLTLTAPKRSSSLHSFVAEDGRVSSNTWRWQRGAEIETWDALELNGTHNGLAGKELQEDPKLKTQVAWFICFFVQSFTLIELIDLKTFLKEYELIYLFPSCLTFSPFL